MNALRPRAREQILALVPGLLLVVLILQCWPVVVDDAFISLRHARIAVETGVLSFNPGERIEAYSNFSQVMLAVGLLRLGWDPVPLLQVLGALAALATLPITYRLARRCGANHAFGALAVLLVSMHVGYAFCATAGLETPFYALLLTAGVLCFMRGSSRADVVGALLLVTASLTRTEGPVLMAAIGAQRAVIEWRRGQGAAEIARSNAGWALLFLGLYGAYFAWRWHYYGHFFPSPIYFKQVGGLGELTGTYAASFLRGNALLLAVAVSAPLLGERRAALPLTVVGAFLLIFAGAQQWVFGSVFTMGFYDRYFVPALPCLVAAAAAGLTRLRAQAGGGRALALVLAAALVVWQLLHPTANWVTVRRYVLGYPPAVEARNVPTAHYLTERFGAGGRVVIGDVGRVGYLFPGTIWDLFGLTSYDFTLEHGGDLEAHVRSLLASQPDAWVLCRDDVAGEPCHEAQAVVLELPGFRADYRLTRSFGREEVPTHYFEVYERVAGR